MNTEFFNALDLLEKERGIPKEYMLERVEAALVSAFKRDSGGNTNVRVAIDPVKKDVKVFKQMSVVAEVTDPAVEITVEDAKKVSRRYKLGDTCEIEMKTKNFGRISAQTAKQVIIQGIREAERTMMIKEYESKKEEVITATVVRIDPVNGNAIVDTGTSEAVLLKGEQIPGEEYEVGDHIKVFVMEVNNEVKGPIVTLSRSHFGLVKRLFELEVPEISDGTVVIRGISREAGSRTKMAVESRDKNVDPVGACIGARRSRITSIVDELCGEKIDVIPFSEVPEEFVASALKPATVESVTFENERSCKVIVSPDQLSLAIGKEGQNARLAARLTGYKIDIKTV
ncbi:MAG: transcription termination/antitermination protein NusA [Clostridiales bacterium]|nr:transcription termination/antitermination protein NusA [Clostridiales bacterium]